jgi:hypothetical protein
MGGGGGAAMGGFGGMPGAAEAEKEAREATLDLEKGVSTAASGAEVGELFRYEIQPPVSLPRQKSTMLPIVNQQIQGEKVSIYNLQVEPKHPLNGLQITNTTDLHLMQGPITVFDGGEYAGDARIADVPPGGKRLISYALDLDVEVADEPPEGPKDREAAKRPDETCLAKFERFAGAVIGQAPSQRSRELVQVRLLKGVVLVNYRLKRSHRYLVKNAGAKSKRVLVEQQIDADWKLVSPPKPEEKTGDLYRFAVQVAAGESEALIVEEEQLIHEEIKVDSIPDGQVALFLKSSEVSAGVKTALSELVKHKRALADLAEQRRLLETRVTSISQEQTRIRQNIQNLDRTGDLYGRYVRRLEEQEDELEKLHAQMEKLQADEASQRKAFDERLLKLDLS